MDNNVENLGEGKLLINLNYFPTFLSSKPIFNMPWGTNRLDLLQHDNILLVKPKEEYDKHYWNPRCWGSLDGFTINEELLAKKKPNCILISEYLYCRGTAASGCLKNLKGKCECKFNWHIKANQRDKVVVHLSGTHGDAFVPGQNIFLNAKTKEKVLQLALEIGASAKNIKQTLDTEALRLGRQFDYTITVKEQKTITNLIHNFKKKNLENVLQSLGGHFSFNDWQRFIQLLSIDNTTHSYDIIYPENLNTITPDNFVLVLSSNFLLEKTKYWLEMENNNIVGLDSIYKLNKYFFPFWHIIVTSPAPYARGIPFVTVLCNSSTEENVAIALLAIKHYFLNKFQYNFDPVFMIDKDKAEMAGLKASGFEYIFCEFHRKKSIQKRITYLGISEENKVAIQLALDKVGTAKTIPEALNLINTELYDKFDFDDFSQLYEYLETNWFVVEQLIHWIHTNRPHRRGLWNTNNFTEASFRAMIKNFLQYKGHRTMYNLTYIILFQVIPHWIDILKSFDEHGALPPRNQIAAAPRDIEKSKKIAYLSYFYFNDFQKMITQTQHEQVYKVVSTSIDFEYTVNCINRITCSCVKFHYDGYCKHCAAVQYFSNTIDKPSEQQISQILSETTNEDKQRMIHSTFKINRNTIVEQETLTLFTKMATASHHVDDPCIGFGISKKFDLNAPQECNLIFTMNGSANFNHDESLNFFHTTNNFCLSNKLHVLFFLVYINVNDEFNENSILTQDILHRLYLVDKIFPNLPLIYFNNYSFEKLMQSNDPNLDGYHLTLRSAQVFSDCKANLDSIHSHLNQDISDCQIRSTLCNVYNSQNLPHRIHHLSNAVVIQTGNSIDRFKTNSQVFDHTQVQQMNILESLKTLKATNQQQETLLLQQNNDNRLISPLKQTLQQSAEFGLNINQSPIQQMDYVIDGSSFEPQNVQLSAFNKSPAQQRNIFITASSPLPFNLPESTSPVDTQFPDFSHNLHPNLVTSFENPNDNSNNPDFSIHNNNNPIGSQLPTVSIDLNNSAECDRQNQLQRDLNYSDESNAQINSILKKKKKHQIQDEDSDTDSEGGLSPLHDIFHANTTVLKKIPQKFQIFSKILRELGNDSFTGKPVSELPLQILEPSDFSHLPMFYKEPTAKILVGDSIIYLFLNQLHKPDYLKKVKNNVTVNKYNIPLFQQERELVGLMLGLPASSVEFFVSPECDTTKFKRHILVDPTVTNFFSCAVPKVTGQIIICQKSDSTNIILFRCKKNHFSSGTCFHLFSSMQELIMHQTTPLLSPTPNTTTHHNFTAPKVHTSPNLKIIPTRKRNTPQGKMTEQQNVKRRQLEDPSNFVSRGRPGRPKVGPFSKPKAKPKANPKNLYPPQKKQTEKQTQKKFPQENESLSRQFEAAQNPKQHKRISKPRHYFGDT